MSGASTPLLLNNSHEEGEGKPATTRSVVRAFGIESRKLWKIAGPTIVTAICQYSLGALTQTFAGFVGELELAAVAVENSVVAGLAFGIMVSFTYIPLFITTTSPVSSPVSTNTE